MLGPSHALSGAAVWFTGSLAMEQFAHYHQSPIQLAVGTAMCAGGALVPDLDLSGRVISDQGGATVAHTFGVVSLFAAEVIEKMSLGIYDVTKTRRDPRRHNGHRTFTHTLPFNLAVGYGVFECACATTASGRCSGTLFLTFAFALRWLVPAWSERAGWIIVTLVADRRYVRGGPTRSFRRPRVSGAGCRARRRRHRAHARRHADQPRVSGVSGRSRSRGRCGTASACRTAISVKVGGRVEVFVLRTLFLLMSIAGAAGLAEPWLRGHVDRFTG